MSDKTKTKVIKAQIVLEGADEYRKSIREINADMQELNNCIQSVNSSIKQLTKSLQKHSKLLRQADIYSDVSSTSALQ